MCDVGAVGSLNGAPYRVVSADENAGRAVGGAYKEKYLDNPAARVSLREQFEKRLAQNQHDFVKNKRVLDILSRHPEFEELLELQELLRF